MRTFLPPAFRQRHALLRMSSPAALGARGAELFRAQAALYASHRPSYPAELFDTALSFAGLEPGRQTLALDVATGTGQVRKHLGSGPFAWQAHHEVSPPA